jgi:signal transduction histidine kinase
MVGPEEPRLISKQQRGVAMSEGPGPSTPIGESLGRHEQARRDLVPYVLAAGLTLFAFATTSALKQAGTAPSFMCFVPAVAIASWAGGRGPTLLATVLSLLLINCYLLAGSLRIAESTPVFDVVAFLVLTVTIAVTMEGLRRARGVAESRAAELERLSTRGSRLREVTAALSEAPSVQDVTAVVMDKGLVAVEAGCGILVYAKGGRVLLLGVRGYEAAMEARIRALTQDADTPYMEALRTGEAIWLASSDELARRYPLAREHLGAMHRFRAHVALPLLYAGESVGSMSLSFVDPSACGAADRTFTLLLAQATAAALHRASSYDSERQKRQQAELLARAREDVLGVVAHDLRNPLHLIGGTTQLLLQENLAPAQRAKLSDTARRAVSQMNRLIGDLLDTVRLQSGRLALEIEDVSVSSILWHAEESCAPLAASRQVRLLIDRPDDGIAVSADAFRVSQVLENLVGNALKFTPAGGTVAVRVLREDARVVFQVVDTGPGIPASDLPHLFEDFWQARKADRRGVGLGLAIVKGLVEAQGGAVDVTSTVGMGSTFSFSLPLVVASAGRQRKSSGPAMRPSDLTLDRQANPGPPPQH